MITAEQLIIGTLYHFFQDSERDEELSLNKREEPEDKRRNLCDQ